MKLDIIHTNDIHSNIQNFAKVSHYINDVRKGNSHTLVLDAGDMITGEYQFNFFKGNIESEIANIIGYDAYAVGNHGFDYGVDFLKKHMDKFDNKFIQSNIINTDECLSNFTKVKYFEFGMKKVGIISFTSTYITSVIDIVPKFTELNNNIDLIKKVANETDYLIVLSHLGLPEEESLARLGLPIDVIIGAHSHHTISNNTFINDTLIVQTGCFLKNVGHIEINFETNKLNSKLIRLDNYHLEDEKVKKVIVDYEKKLLELGLKTYGSTKTKLVADRHLSMRESTNFGSLICDSYFHYCKLKEIPLDFGLINSKGIRKDIEPGIITNRELYNAIPFSKKLYVVKMSGKELKDSIDNSYIDIQTSKLKIEKYKDKAGIIHSKLSTVDGKELIDNKYYNVMTVDYLYNSESFLPMGKCEIVHKSEDDDLEIVGEYIKTLPENFDYLSNKVVSTIDKT